MHDLTLRHREVRGQANVDDVRTRAIHCHGVGGGIGAAQRKRQPAHGRRPWQIEDHIASCRIDEEQPSVSRRQRRRAVPDHPGAGTRHAANGLQHLREVAARCDETTSLQRVDDLLLYTVRPQVAEVGRQHACARIAGPEAVLADPEEV
ncbi:hypothetical protein EJO70_24645 [Variovorax sp. 553]|nr:hypothetical protein EJO70_24645 [Variovorax sp. 553]RSZ35915.1 hypothetical protein EJO71_25845 [Variovorax sp. 679]